MQYGGSSSPAELKVETFKTMVLAKMLKADLHKYNDIVYLKYDVLVAIAISAAKRIYTVGGGRPVQNHRLVGWSSQVVLHFTPLEKKI